MITGIYTELIANGGVQRMARHMAAAQVSYAKETNKPHRIYSLNDPTGNHHIECEGIRFEFTGFNRAKRQFAKAAVSSILRGGMMFINHPNLSPLGNAARAINPKVGYVVHAHGIEVWNPMSYVCRKSLQRARLVTASSNHTGEQVHEKQGVDSNRIRTLYPAIDTQFLQNMGEVSDEPVLSRFLLHPFILTITRLVQADSYKGVDTTIRAVATIPGLHYVIVGDGDDLHRLKGVAEAAGVADRVHFLGRQSDTALRWLYHHCQIFVMPSQGEGFGIVFLEAMAFSKPCIGGSEGGTPEVVREGQTGFVVGRDEQAILQHRIMQLITDKKLSARFGSHGRALVEEQFSYAKFRIQMDSIFSGETGK